MTDVGVVCGVTRLCVDVVALPVKPLALRSPPRHCTCCVGKKASAKGKKSPWIAACNAARKALNIKGFCAIKKGTPLYNKAKALYKK